MLKSILEDRNRLALTAQLALCHTVPVLLHQVFMTGIVYVDRGPAVGLEARLSAAETLCAAYTRTRTLSAPSTPHPPLVGLLSTLNHARSFSPSAFVLRLFVPLLLTPPPPRKLGLFKQYSIQPPAKTPFDQKPALFAKVWFDTALNHLVKIPLAILLALPLLSKRITGMSARDSLTLPPLKTLGLHLLASIVIEDALFYWSHRILHDKWLFKHVHRKHHEFHNLAAYPIASEYVRRALGGGGGGDARMSRALGGARTSRALGGARMSRALGGAHMNLAGTSASELWGAPA
jgi:hypothetical protein